MHIVRQSRLLRSIQSRLGEEKEHVMGILQYFRYHNVA